MVLISREDKLALQRLKEAAEKAKIELSSTSQTEVNFTIYNRGPKWSKTPNIKTYKV